MHDADASSPQTGGTRPPTTGQRPGHALAAALLFNPVIGSIYAWSVFIRPLELSMDASRADISLAFSIGLVSFAGGALLAPPIYRFLPPPLLLFLAAGISAAGLLFAETDPRLLPLLSGYGALFGVGAGIAYSVTMQTINSAVRRRLGLWNGLGIGAFAVGPILLALPLSWSAERFGPHATFQAMAVALLLLGLVAAVLLRAGGVAFPRLLPGRQATGYRTPPFPLIWAGFGLAAGAGMMTIGHAAGMVLEAGASATLAAGTVAAAGIGNAGGRVSAGWLCDRRPAGEVAMTAHALAFAGFVMILAPLGLPGVVAGVAIQGLAYGLASGVYPSLLTRHFGAGHFGRYFGAMLTGSGSAGLITPWLAGQLFDVTGGYDAAAIAGLFMAAAAIAVGYRLPRPA